MSQEEECELNSQESNSEVEKARLIIEPDEDQVMVN